MNWALSETYHYFNFIEFGQDILNYLVDLIAIFLLLLGALASLRDKTRSASGWLAAAWGFVTCLNYRAFSWRYEARLAEEISNEPASLLIILAMTLAVSFLAFGISLYLVRPQKLQVKS